MVLLEPFQTAFVVWLLLRHSRDKTTTKVVVVKATPLLVKFVVIQIKHWRIKARLDSKFFIIYFVILTLGFLV